MTFYLLFGMIDSSERPENTFETSESLLFLVWILFGRCTFSFYRQRLLLSLHAFLWKCIKWESNFENFILLIVIAISDVIIFEAIFISYSFSKCRVITTGYNGFLWFGLCRTFTTHSHCIPIFIYPSQVFYWEFRQFL